MARVVARLTYNRIPEIVRKLPREAQSIALETAFDIESEIKTGMAESKSGAWYGDHQASAPGEMPAIDQGELVNSIQTESLDRGAAVYTNSKYAAPLEFGAPMANLEPRPFFAPATEAHRDVFIERMSDLERRL